MYSVETKGLVWGDYPIVTEAYTVNTKFMKADIILVYSGLINSTRLPSELEHNTSARVRNHVSCLDPFSPESGRSNWCNRKWTIDIH